MKPAFIYLTIILILISGCALEPKTQPIVVEQELETEPEISDVTGAVAAETVENDTIELNETERETTKTIVIEDIKFKPDKITIPAGTTVIWEHRDTFLDRDNIVHMVMVYPIGKRSERMFYGATFNITFDEPGEYNYIDVIFKESMSGEITVE